MENRAAFWDLVDQSGGHDACWPWLGRFDRHGYGYLGRERSHRIAWERGYRESLRPGQAVMHSCDNPACCNPRHLLAASPLDNVADRTEKGRSARGSGNGRAVLTEDIVRLLLQTPGSYAELAAQFGVSKWTVRDIKTGATWSWLSRDIPTVGIKKPSGC